MKILITGSKGFVGKNLFYELNNIGHTEIFEYDIETDKSLLNHYVENCDFIFHLAGVNRPIDNKEFMDINMGLTSELIQLLKKHNNKAAILYTSSIQAALDNDYGRSKKAAEDLLFDYSRETGTDVYIYRLTNLFGKWSKPNYNSVVSTYCYNIARNLDIQINNPDTMLRLCYIDDLLNEFINALNKKPIKQDHFCIVPLEYSITLDDLAKTIKSFKDSRNNLHISNMQDDLTKKLYSTYLSFLPNDQFAYSLHPIIDSRGSFTEFLKTQANGQTSISITKPGITRGNHWHHTKNEKFLVVYGEGLVRLRKLDESEVIEYTVSGNKLQILDIPVGYTHSIINTGTSDLITVMWANEIFNPDKADTYYLEV